MRKSLLALLFVPLAACAQVSNPSIVAVSVAPSGACTSNLPLKLKTPGGTLYSCQNGTWGISGGGSGTAGTVTLENVFASAGSFSFQHNLNSIYNQVHCITHVGSVYSPATWTDSPDNAAPTTNTIVTVPSAGTYDCSFSSTATLAPNFLIAVAPTTLLFQPTMTGTQQPTFAVTQTSQGGYSGTATYSTIGLASGMSGAFSPTTITGAGGNTLTVSFPATQAAATTPFTVSATDGTLTHTASPSLTVGNINFGLIECWAMTDGSGSTLADSCPNSNPATITGTATWASNSPLPGITPTFPTGVFANGANNTAVNFTGTTPFSVTSWVSTNGVQTEKDVVGTLQTGPAATGWEFGVVTPGATEVQAYIISNAGTSNLIHSICSGATFTTGIHFIGMTYDGSQTVGGIKLYQDGVACPSYTNSGTLTGSSASTQPVTIAGRTGGNDYLLGVEAYTRIYNRVLSPADMTAYFAAGAR
jgi:hypothetical protein